MRTWHTFFSTRTTRGLCCGPCTGYRVCCGGDDDASNGAFPVRKNLNMMSAFTHIVGDTLRTIAMFCAALVATLTGIDGDICDAWAALAVTVTILILCASLCLDIYTAATDIWYEEFVDASGSSNFISRIRGMSRGGAGSSGGGSSGSSIGSSSGSSKATQRSPLGHYSRVNVDEDDSVL
jgi:uncharacterized membrane protein YgcG